MRSIVDTVFENMFVDNYNIAARKSIYVDFKLVINKILYYSVKVLFSDDLRLKYLYLTKAKLIVVWLKSCYNILFNTLNTTLTITANEPYILQRDCLT